MKGMKDMKNHFHFWFSSSSCFPVGIFAIEKHLRRRSGREKEKGPREGLALRPPDASFQISQSNSNKPSQKGYMKSYLKIFALLFVVTASAAVLSACSDNNPPPPPPPAPAPEPVRPNS
jgi:hypothetical protein